MDKQEKSEINSKIKRIDAKYISHEVQHLFHIEKGYLYTIKPVSYTHLDVYKRQGLI